MKILITDHAKVLAELEVDQNRSFFLTDSEKIQKTLSPLPIKKNQKIELDPATTIIILEQLLPSLQVMDPLLEESMTSPGLSLKRVLDSLDDRKALNTNLDSNVVYNVDYDTGKISYAIEQTLLNPKGRFLGRTVSKATLGDLVSNL